MTTALAEPSQTLTTASADAVATAQNATYYSQSSADGNSTENASASSRDLSVASVAKPSADANLILNGPLNSLGAVASAVSNLSRIMSTKAQAKSEVGSSYFASMVQPDEDKLKQHISLPPDNMAELAKRVFDYTDQLRKVASTYEERYTERSSRLTGDKLAKVRSSVSALSSQAVRLGVTTADHAPSVPMIQNDPDDAVDPYAGGSPESLNSASLSAEQAQNSAISSLLQAIEEDRREGNEDETLGDREPAINSWQKDPQHATADTLYADGTPVNNALFEGMREGESAEEMLRRVQQSALDQLSAEENMAPFEAASENLPKTHNIHTPDPLPTNNSASDPHRGAMHDGPHAQEETVAQGFAGATGSASNSAPKDFSKIAPPEAQIETESVFEVAEDHKNSFQEGVKLDKTYNISSKGYSAEITLKEMQDPFGDGDAGEFKLSSYATSERAPDAALHKSLAPVGKKEDEQYSGSPVAGSKGAEVVDNNAIVDPKAALTPKAKEHDAAVPASDTVAAPETSESATCYTPEYMSDELPQDDDYYDEESPQADTAGSAYALDLNEDHDVSDASAVTSKPSPGIVPLADGSTANVPVAEKTERERIERSFQDKLGRTVGPDDFMEAAETSDLWACDFKAAGFNDSALYSALSSSVRRIDPADPDRWIIVMSDSFRLFSLDPNFSSALSERFSALKKRRIEVCVQLCPGLPEGCVRTLALRLYEKALSDARSEFINDEGAAQIAKLAGADLNSCRIRLFSAAKLPVEKA